MACGSTTRAQALHAEPSGCRRSGITCATCLFDFQRIVYSICQDMSDQAQRAARFVHVGNKLTTCAALIRRLGANVLGTVRKAPACHSPQSSSLEQPATSQGAGDPPQHYINLDSYMGIIHNMMFRAAREKHLHELSSNWYLVQILRDVGIFFRIEINEHGEIIRDNQNLQTFMAYLALGGRTACPECHWHCLRVHQH
jgi:hypothetical protein